jgi:hypothetical protein
VAKPNPLGLRFDLLEGRCLLNATVFALSPLGQVPPDTIGKMAERTSIVSPESRFPYGIEAAPAREPFVFHSQAPVYSQDLSSPQTTLLITGGELAPRIIPGVLEESIPPQVTIFLFTDHSAEPPRYVPPVVEESVPPLVTANVVAGHYGQQTQQVQQISSVEADSSGERSHLSLAQASQGKVSMSFGPLHEQSAVAFLSATGQTSAKMDHVASPALVSSPAGQLSGTAMPFIGQGTQGAPLGNPTGQDRQTHDKAVEAAVATSPAELETRLSSVRETFAFSELEPGSWSSATLVTNILPFDFSSLETSVRDFFDQLDQFGLKLSENHVSLLFSSGIAAAAATLALEFARRKIQALHMPTLERADLIPYSDYL